MDGNGFEDGFEALKSFPASSPQGPKLRQAPPDAVHKLCRRPLFLAPLELTPLDPGKRFGPKKALKGLAEHSRHRRILNSKL